MNKVRQGTESSTRTQPTGTLKPPTKRFPKIDFEDRDKRCRTLCESTRQDVVLYHDERGDLSYRTVRDSQTMKLPVSVLAVYRFVQGRVTEKYGLMDQLVKSETAIPLRRS
jgi:hypothetical protein